MITGSWTHGCSRFRMRAVWTFQNLSDTNCVTMHIENSCSILGSDQLVVSAKKLISWAPTSTRLTLIIQKVPKVSCTKNSTVAARHWPKSSWQSDQQALLVSIKFQCKNGKNWLMCYFYRGGRSEFVPKLLRRWIRLRWRWSKFIHHFKQYSRM